MRHTIMCTRVTRQVLHKILDEAEAGETVVGISNWELDSAKMNRAVHLHRPPPTVDDLALTAKGTQLCGNNSLITVV